MSRVHDEGEAAGFREADGIDPGQPDGTRSDGSGSSTGQDGDAVRGDLPTRRQLREQQASGEDAEPVARPYREPMPGGRRDRRLQLTAQMTALRSAPGLMTFVPQPVPQDRRIEDMSIEEALAARQAIAADARERAADSRAGGADGSSAVVPSAVAPLAVDPEVLAQQRALAERAAELAARGRRLQDSSEQGPQPMPTPTDPTSADNLSILALPEVVHVPGGTQAVLRAPMTSHVPVVLQSPHETSIGTGNGLDAEGEARTGAGVEADPDARMAPITARSAFGLEPLDAMTAGLGRLRRIRYIQYSLLGVGAAALATGIIMTVSSLNG